MVQLLNDTEVFTIDRLGECDEKQLLSIAIVSLYEILKECRKLSAVFYDGGDGHHDGSGDKNGVQPVDPTGKPGA